MKASDGYRLKLLAAGALAGFTLIPALGLAMAASFPDASVPVFTKAGVGAEARADAASRNGTPLPEALATTKAELGAQPMDAAGWLRIAYLKSADGKPLDAESLDAIEKSYTVSPYGPGFASWRLRFLYEHWDQLTPDIRTDVTDEYTTITQALGSPIDPTTLENPSGRLAAQLTQLKAKSATPPPTNPVFR